MGFSVHCMRLRGEGWGSWYSQHYRRVPPTPYYDKGTTAHSTKVELRTEPHGIFKLAYSVFCSTPLHARYLLSWYYKVVPGYARTASGVAFKIGTLSSASMNTAQHWLPTEYSTSHTSIRWLFFVSQRQPSCRWAPFQVLQGVFLHLQDTFDWLQCDSNGAVHQRRRLVYRLLLHEQGLLNLDASCPCILVQYSAMQNRLIHRLCWLPTSTV
ncbi:hypothetical protein J3E68DRAFT_400287 [Trichoderma sp. SZMC 28012]